MTFKVLLINPPSSRLYLPNRENYFPLALMSLASVLKENSVRVKIADIENHFYSHALSQTALYYYLKTYLHRILQTFHPDLIGIGCIFSGAFHNVTLIAHFIKQQQPNTPIVIGGIHPTVFAEEILTRYSDTDYIVLGEGEDTLVSLVGVLTNRDKDVRAIDGIAFRCKGKVIVNPKTKYIYPLDELPYPDYKSIDVKTYKMDTSQWYSPGGKDLGQPFPIISSRSCPQKCSFCSMWLAHGAGFRPRTAKHVLDEMEYLYKEYKTQFFQFMDDNMTFDKSRTMELCAGIHNRGMNIQFETPNGIAINRLDRQMIDALVKAGMTRTALGIESGSDYIRNKVIRKGLSTEKIYDIVNACAEHNTLFIKGFFVIGFVEETLETLQDTYNMITSLPFDKISVNFVTPYPGTAFYKQCIKAHLLRYKEEDYLDVATFQDSDPLPHIKPSALTYDNLIDFKHKCMAYMDGKREKVKVPNNYPLRYVGTR